MRVAYLPHEQILFTGDLCVNWKSGNNLGDRDADHQNWVRALNQMTTWNVKTVIPGHGMPGNAGNSARTKRVYWRSLDAGFGR